jgi:hypothetical protein
MVEQRTAKNTIAAINFEFDLLESTICCMSKPAPNHKGDLIGCRVGHEHGVETNATGRVGRDGSSRGLTLIVEPEQLREVVG